MATSNKDNPTGATAKKAPFKKKDAIMVGGALHIKYTTVNGIECHLRALPPLQQALIEENMNEDPDWGPRPQPPTYTMTLGGGGTEERFYDKESVAQDGTDEEKAAYAKYSEELQAWAIEFVGRQFDMMVLDGVIVDVPPLDTWKRSAERRGIRRFPDDEEDLKILYVKFKVMRHPRDADRIGSIIGYLNENQQKGVSELVDSVFQA